MRSLTWAGRLVPSALVAASTVALIASPASAATITQINVSTSAIPRAANCVYLSAEPSSGSGRISDAYHFSAGSTLQVGNFPVNTGETVRFEWHSNDCGPRSTLSTTSYTAPDVTTWNIN